MNKRSNREVEQAEARNTGKNLGKARKAENKKVEVKQERQETQTK